MSLQYPLSLKCNLLGKGRDQAIFHKQEAISNKDLPGQADWHLRALPNKEAKNLEFSQEETQLYRFTFLFLRLKVLILLGLITIYGFNLESLSSVSSWDFRSFI